ncbi:unnamed protein product [Peniophora sp. CBMAI 1063]|nr:unnamed protein product [Peniophora sp. CBMAI 1063]
MSSPQALGFDHLFHGPAEPPTPLSSSVMLDSPSDVRTPSSAVSRRLGYFELDRPVQTIHSPDRHPPSIQLHAPSLPRHRQVQSMYAYVMEPLEMHGPTSFKPDRPEWTTTGERTPSPSSRVRPLPLPPIRERPTSTASDVSSAPSLSISGSSANTSPLLSPQSSPQPARTFSTPIELLPSPWSSLEAPAQWQPSPPPSPGDLGSPHTAKHFRALPLPPTADRPGLARSKTSATTWSTAATEDGPRTPRSASLFWSRSPRHGAQALQRTQSNATVSSGWTSGTPRQEPAQLGRAHTIRRELPGIPQPVPATASLATPTSFAEAQQAGLARKRTLSVDERSMRRRGVATFTGLAALQELPLIVERDLPPLPPE